MAEWQRKPIQTGARATPPISPNNVFLTTQVDGSLSKANLTVALDSKISGVSLVSTSAKNPSVENYRDTRYFVNLSIF